MKYRDLSEQDQRYIYDVVKDDRFTDAFRQIQAYLCLTPSETVHLYRELRNIVAFEKGAPWEETQKSTY